MARGNMNRLRSGTAGLLGTLLLAAALPAQEESRESPDLERMIQDLREEVDRLRRTTDSLVPGSHAFVMTGFGELGYTDLQGRPSTFGAAVNPIFLWQVEENLLVETELEVELEDRVANMDLGYANLSYVLSDEWMIGGGKFLTPFGLFSERIHPSWINRLPDAPLVFAHGTGLVPPSSLGVWARGAVRQGDQRLNYAFFLTNGPAMTVADPGGGAEGDHGATGALEFDNYDDINSNKAFGGRLGFLPAPELEVGVSGMWADVLPAGMEQASARLYGLDVTFQHRIPSWKGNLRFLAEWVWSQVDSVAFPGVRAFDNRRNGGYLQASFRFLGAASDFLSRIEPVVRFDRLNQPNDVEGSFDEQRWTFGVDYWIGPSAALKVAWRMDEILNGDREEGDALLVQFAMGF